MAFTLPELPYASDALEPAISARTLSFHHGKHHAGYVTKLNAALEGTRFASMDLVTLIKSIDDVPADKRKGVFNNAAQHFNHSFYWTSMTPGGGGAPSGSFLAAINKAFGDLDGLKKRLGDSAGGHFGSGWAWLVKKADGGLDVLDTHDADTPLAPSHGDLVPLLTIDVWEHAYYLDYQNQRPAYVEKVIGLLDWNFAQKRFGG